MREPAGERIQKILAQLGLASRREAEEWIRAGRITLNGHPVALGDRAGPEDRLQLDGRPVRRRATAALLPVLLCHRSPGMPLLRAEGELQPLVANLPTTAGRRFVSISPMPRVDGGLELLTSDGALALRLQRAVRGLEVEYSVRLRGELLPEGEQALLAGQLDSGERLRVQTVEAEGGEGANRWYRIVTLGASGNHLRQLLERQGLVVSRILRTRLGKVALERSLARGRTRPLADAELATLLGEEQKAAAPVKSARQVAPAKAVRPAGFRPPDRRRRRKPGR